MSLLRKFCALLLAACGGLLASLRGRPGRRTPPAAKRVPKRSSGLRIESLEDRQVPSAF